MNTPIQPDARSTVRRPKTAAFRQAAVFMVFFLASALRFLYYGFRYFPQLDDYIQYHNLAQSTDFAAVIENFGLLASRPLAGVSDIFIWSRFWGGLIAAVLILSAAWAASALLFRAVLSVYFPCGYFFVGFYLLLPLNFEGTYWLSASTRIVCGMFFCALSLYLLERWYATKKAVFLPLWLIAQLTAFCYYEQILALTGFMTLFLMLLRVIRCERRPLAALLTLGTLAVYFIFTAANSGGALSARIDLLLPWQEGYFTGMLPGLLRQIGAAFIKGGTLTLFKGFVRGVTIIFADGAWLYTLSFLALSAGVYFIVFDSAKQQTSVQRTDGSGLSAITPYSQKTGRTILSALLMLIAPLAPYFVLTTPWFSLRAVVPSLVGASLLFDTLLTLLTRHHAALKAAALAVFVFLAGIASVSELHDYKAAYNYDTEVMAILAEKTAGTGLRTGILNLNARFPGEQNYYFHEHIHGVIESDWALQGALYATHAAMPEVVPLATDGFSYYANWNRSVKQISGFGALYWWDPEKRTLTPLTAEGSDEAGWTLYDPDGGKIAFIWEESPPGKPLYGYIQCFD